MNTPTPESTRLASQGGAPVRERFLPIAVPDIGGAFDASQTALNLVSVGFSLGLAATVLYLGAIGDPRVPYVVGALWNAKARPPATPANAQAGMRMIRSHNGVTVTIEDDAARRALVLETPAGQRITLDDSAAIRIEDATGNRITLTSAGIRIESSSRVTVAAPSVEVDAGQVTVNAGMSRFSGVVQCDTLIATSVVAQSYTPGAGNIS